MGDDPGQRAYGAGHRVAAADRAHGDDWADGALRGRSDARLQCREGAASERAVHGADGGGASGECGSEEVRCAIFTGACEVPVASEIRAAIERAGRELQKMGIAVEAVKPPIDEGDRLWWEYNGADGNQILVEALGEGLKHSRERLRNFMIAGESKSAAEFFKIAMLRDGWRVQLAEFMERYPIILGQAFAQRRSSTVRPKSKSTGKHIHTLWRAGRWRGATARGCRAWWCRAEKIARDCRSDCRSTGAPWRGDCARGREGGGDGARGISEAAAVSAESRAPNFCCVRSRDDCFDDCQV